MRTVGHSTQPNLVNDERVNPVLALLLRPFSLSPPDFIYLSWSLTPFLSFLLQHRAPHRLRPQSVVLKRSFCSTCAAYLTHILLKTKKSYPLLELARLRTNALAEEPHTDFSTLI